MRRFCIRRWTFILALIAAACLFGGVSPSGAQQLLPVTAKVQIARGRAVKQTAEHGMAADLSNVVVWLTLLDSGVPVSTASEAAKVPPVLSQRNKSFEPHERRETEVMD
jgi:hypothetical protein